MEKTSRRSLAYQLATVIRLDELDDICGGNRRAFVPPSIRITNGYAGHSDCVYD